MTVSIRRRIEILEIRLRAGLPLVVQGRADDPDALRLELGGEGEAVEQRDAGQVGPEQQRHDRLTALAVPLVQISLDHGGIDEGAIFAIAEQLTDQMNLEAA